jgi:uncharacterized protein (DUF2126 family)/transglutaminase-like putative cysteine protease
MAIHVALNHRTVYRYDRHIGLGPQVVRLRPAPHCRTPILSYSLKVSPAQHFINWQQDPQSNYLARLVFPEKTDHLTIEVDLVADMAVINPFDFFLEPSAEFFPLTYDHGLDAELAPFRVCEAPGPLLARWLRSVDRKQTHIVEFLIGLNQRLQKEIGYVIRLEPGVQTCEDTLTLLKGSCRDSAWLLVQILRHLGFAARFVSGYLLQLAPDQKSLDGPSGPSADFTDLHAWTEVYLPGAGWIGLDPTSGLMAGEGHIPLACSPDPTSAAPITGAHEKAEVEFEHHMQITRVLETARVTKPYTREQWQGVLDLGRVIDADLQNNDVRLTMGGEPTFVSVDDRDGAEWNTAALGPTKRKLAGDLIRRLANRGKTGYLLHYGQGKWYPGETLPRWALGCYWRKDGEPLWRNPDLFAGDQDKSRNIDHATAARFAAVLAERLHIDPGYLIPAFEDSWYYLWRERRLPANVNPLSSKLRDAEERARLARLFDRGLDTAAGTVLPIQRIAHDGVQRWSSGFWPMRSEQMFLIPGDSPMGYRLPLDSLPWVTEGDYPYMVEQDPFEPRAPLPPRRAYQPQVDPRTGRPVNGGSATGAVPFAPRGQRLERRERGEDLARQLHAARTSLRPGKSEPGIVRTALCVEPRDGLLHVFMPPLYTNEDYLDLIAAVEDTAEDLGQKVIIEGYKPQSDPRLGHFSVTPDPGVIEVNVEPSASWDELVERTTVLYEEARNTRLSTEKFMVDGRHVGTGGGNHITLGGWSAADSPMLRRPDVLRSLIAYWHNHPALSYLFSGLFIGPTSQAPRVDEARNDAVYELEIALSQIRDHQSPPPWFVDRVLRNVLVDVTGNTHRSEFCIDKLYTPEGGTGRLGIVEMRAFEMPPHAEMSLTQQLLVRALIARFWREPYNARLVRWNTQLHDRFMLPHFIAEDVADVVEELRRAGYGFDPHWLEPHFEFKFPVLGQAAYRGIDMELRYALEPWHVTGEEGAAGGNVRYVDSAVERVQLRVRNLVDSRHVVSCNGRQVPLHPTGTEGEYVAGVRFKAWAPPASLHPQIPAHAPLVFDVVDTWSGRSVGGFTYHTAHPGGVNYQAFPVNANGAEARRRERFFRFGHTPGTMNVLREPLNREHPFTLDLRHPPAGRIVE